MNTNKSFRHGFPFALLKLHDSRSAFIAQQGKAQKRVTTMEGNGQDFLKRVAEIICQIFGGLECATLEITSRRAGRWVGDFIKMKRK